MSKIYTAADQLIGHTPLLELSHIEKEEQLPAHVIAKLEYFNPAGSVKDRIAKKMIDDAEAKGLLKEGSCQGLPHHHRDARDHERGAPPADEGLRCRAGAERGCQGHEGCHCQGR